MAPGWLRLAAVLLPLAACGTAQPGIDVSNLPAGILSGGPDPDVAAVNVAQWAFADSARTYGKPLEAARAALAMDYIAGQIDLSPRWANVSAQTKEQLLDGRAEVRATLGVAPGTTSQQVVDGLAAAARALDAGDQAAAIRALGPPVFPAGGQAVLGILSNMPYLRSANAGTRRLETELFDPGPDQTLGPGPRPDGPIQ